MCPLTYVFLKFIKTKLLHPGASPLRSPFSRCVLTFQPPLQETVVRMSSELLPQDLASMGYSELEQQGLLGACMEGIYAARHDTRYNRQCLVGSQRHHWRCMHEKRRPKTRAWAGELRRQARKKEHVRARRQAGVIPSIASSEFEKTHPQLVHTQPRTGVDLRCRCHSSCTVVCRFEV